MVSKYVNELENKIINHEKKMKNHIIVMQFLRLKMMAKILIVSLLKIPR